ncbi:hypothetical protein BGW39_001243 [Mortierella sp. 14UC]|nr:hypothetical protein BGW39_001243 [Mortierella sp. 14UC]
MINPLFLFFIIAVIIIICACIGMCVRPKPDPKAVQHCLGCRCHDLNNNVVLVPVYPQPPQPAYVSAAAAPLPDSVGIRLEAAPPVTVIDMPCTGSPVPPAAEFSSHPKPTVVTISFAESESEKSTK